MNNKHTELAELLEERSHHYGLFTGIGKHAQRIKNAIHAGDNWPSLRDDEREALDMLAHKLARILSGDPEIVDHWLDAAGYLKLISDRMEREGKQQTDEFRRQHSRG